MNAHHSIFIQDETITDQDIEYFVYLGWQDKTIAGFLNVYRSRVARVRKKYLKKYGIKSNRGIRREFISRPKFLEMANNDKDILIHKGNE